MEKYGEYHLNQGIKPNTVFVTCTKNTSPCGVPAQNVYPDRFLKEPTTKVQIERHSAELQAYTFEGD